MLIAITISLILCHYEWRAELDERFVAVSTFMFVSLTACVIATELHALIAVEVSCRFQR